MKIPCKLLAMLALWAAAAVAFAQFPSQPVRLIVPYPAGGGADALARVVAEGLRPLLSQPVVVENRPGASSNIGVAALVGSKPDGHTLLLAENAALMVNEHLFFKLPYKPDVDFTYVGAIGRIPLVLVVNPSFPAATLSEFLSSVRTQPAPLNYASAGYGTPHHMAMELFAQHARVSLSHVPYKGAAPALQDVMSGQVPAMMIDLGSGLQAIRAGRVRALAVAMPQRSELLRDVPTFSERGIDNVHAYGYLGIVGPAGMPPALVTQLNEALNAAVRQPVAVPRLTELGLELMTGTPAQFRESARTESARWGSLIRTLGLRVE